MNVRARLSAGRRRTDTTGGGGSLLLVDADTIVRNDEGVWKVVNDELLYEDWENFKSIREETFHTLLTPRQETLTV